MRTREFDADRALESALDLFRERGYENTSIVDLVDKTGVARAGLYTAFGDKRGLYLAAVRRYIAERDAVAVDVLRSPGSPLDNVRALLDRYAEDARARRRGCLVVNSAVEFADRDPDVAALVQASWQTLLAALTAALSAAKEAGEVAGDPESLAQTVLVLLQGIQVAARAPGTLDAHAAIVGLKELLA